MFKTFRMALSLIVLLSAGAQAQSLEWVEGRHYEKLATPIKTTSGDKIGVTEVFWYGCPHCYSFKPLIEAWEENMPEDVDFELVPAAFGPVWVAHAKAFFTLQVMDKFEETHDALFDALARDKRKLNTPEALADFLADHGVDKDQFIKNYNSFGVNTMLQKAQARIRGAQITGVPAIIVNGKYKTSASSAGSHENMIKVLDYLVEKERAGE